MSGLPCASGDYGRGGQTDTAVSVVSRGESIRTSGDSLPDVRREAAAGCATYSVPGLHLATAAAGVGNGAGQSPRTSGRRCGRRETTATATTWNDRLRNATWCPAGRELDHLQSGCFLARAGQRVLRAVPRSAPPTRASVPASGFASPRVGVDLRSMAGSGRGPGSLGSMAVRQLSPDPIPILQGRDGRPQEAKRQDAGCRARRSQEARLRSPGFPRRRVRVPGGCGPARRSHDQ